MAPKAKIPAPIDRPLSRAYLREFTGLSTAYPPGLSDPTSLRIMDNMLVNRDGSLRVRPGLRYLSYEPAPDNDDLGMGSQLELVGSHEAFYLNDGKKAYLFAVREVDGTVGFRVLQLTDSFGVIKQLTDFGIEFQIPQGAAVLAFSRATTYVRYLQIDNKIFALSDAGEPVRLFTVGEQKTARKLVSIERPDFSGADKLSIRHPDAPWINAGTPLGSRKNLLSNPALEADGFWSNLGFTSYSRTSEVKRAGGYSLAGTPTPVRTNYFPSPLHNVDALGAPGWAPGTFVTSFFAWGDGLRVYATKPADGWKRNDGTMRFAYVNSPNVSMIPGMNYDLSYTVNPVVGGTQELRVNYYTAAGALIGTRVFNTTVSTVRTIHTNIGVTPAGTSFATMNFGFNHPLTGTADMVLQNMLLGPAGGNKEFFTGDTPGYVWTGAPNSSPSVSASTQNVGFYSEAVPVVPGEPLAASAYLRSSFGARSGRVDINWYNSGGALLSVSSSANTGIDDASWTRVSTVANAPAGATQARLVVNALAVPHERYVYMDQAMLEVSSTVKAYFDGDSPTTTTVIYGWDGTQHQSPSTESTYTDEAEIPPAETATANTLISSTAANNKYNYAFFYTFSNEVGESAASMVTTIRAARGWQQWRWEVPNAAGEPNGTTVEDPAKAADQLVAIMPEEVFNVAVAQQAKSWSLYMLTWSDQDSVPVVGLRVASREIKGTPNYKRHGWLRVTGKTTGSFDEMGIPDITNRYNYSDPSKAGQGIVAADRIVLVKDPSATAVVRWSANLQGDYTNFSASKGGGYKTLTSGNLMIPAAVKLWQNPQSADTLTILCMGTDGYSTGYYMAPAAITSQSDNTAVMGFEETTATQGTSSPYGCEVVNNALYHPLDEQLTKSTASNYNISHKSMTDQIEGEWTALAHKEWIISSVHDNRIYFIVDNPNGEPVRPGFKGNEIWVFDAGAENGTWSRFLIPATSLRKIEQGGKIYMSVIRPEGLYYLDPTYDRDDYVDSITRQVKTRFIPWRFETNTQGANRAHDAWCHLQAMSISLGNFQGSMKYGLRAKDLYGREVLIEKTVQDQNPPDLDNHLPFDLDDQLQVKKDMQQWFLFGSSLEGEVGEGEDQTLATLYSSGQVNAVQYRYAPVSVNVGYEHGSIETFEYGRDTVNWGSGNTDNGIPQPFTDMRRP